MNLELLERQLGGETAFGYPPLMRVKPFLERVWPLGRTQLFAALKLKKFHSFLIFDGLSEAGVRVIDTASALEYLRSLSEQARSQEKPARATSHHGRKRQKAREAPEGGG
jgi:hypothetical protein